MNTSLLKLSAGGLPVDWISLEDAITAYATDKVLWELGEDKIVVHGGFQNGLRSTLEVSPIIAVDDKSKKWEKGLVPPLCKKTLYMRDKGICMYCSTPLKRAEMEIEHVIPSSRGGPNKWENVVSACHSCNSKKSNKTPEEAGMQLLAVPYEPNTAEWLILSGRNILADQMDYLQKFVPKRQH